MNDLRLDLAGLFAAGRVGRRAWALSAARVAGAGVLSVADEASADFARAAGVASVLRKRGARLNVVGEPSAVRAVRVAVDLLAPGAAIRWWTVPPVEVAQIGTEPGGWVVFEGPAWCDDVAERAVAAGRSVAVAGGGEGPPPPRGWWLADAWAGDPARGAFGLGGLVVLGWACLGDGQNLDEAYPAFVGGSAAALVADPSPAEIVARASLVAREEAGCRRVLHVVDDPSLEAGLVWASRLVDARLAAPMVVGTGGGGLSRRGSAIVHANVCVLGDAPAMGAFLDAPDDTLLVAWRTRRGAGAGGEGSRALAALCARRGALHVAVELPSPVGSAARTGAFLSLLRTLADATTFAQCGLTTRDETAGMTEWRAALADADVDVDPASA